MTKLSGRSIGMILLALIAIVMSFMLDLPLPGPLLSLTIIYLSFENGTIAGISCTIAVLAVEIFYIGRHGLTGIEWYKIIIILMSQPLMAVIVGTLKKKHDQVQDDLTCQLAIKADTYRRYFDAMMMSIPMIANYPAISMISKDGQYIAANEEAAYIYGYLEDELINKLWYITVYPDDLDIAQQAYEELINSGHSCPATLRGIRKDRSIFLKEVVLVMCRDKEGNFLGHYQLERVIS